jgi:phosphatidate cytidylyltransferase
MFRQRLITAIVFLCIFVGAMYLLPRAYWIAFLALGLIVASAEWARLAGWAYGSVVFYAALTLASFFVLLGGSAQAAEYRLHASLPFVLAYAAAAVFWLVAVPVWLALGWRTRHWAVLGIAGWLALVPTWIAFVELQGAPASFLFILGVVWTADTAAYLVGRRLGRHQLAPTISPGKTWEGAGGAGVAVAVYYALACAAGFPHGAAWNATGGAIVVALLAVTSVEGDLFESWMKRQAGVKDSGTLLPGHGGLLDRIDGLTASVPAAALLMHALPVMSRG